MNSITWKHAPTPRHPGIHVIEEALEDLVPYIDWKYFSKAWGLKTASQEAENQIKEGKDFLKTIIQEKILQAKGVFGFFRVQRIGDSLDLIDTPEYLHFLRQQVEHTPNQTLRSLADYFSPKDIDWIGLFAVSVGFGVETFKKQNTDEYQQMLLHTVSARLTEAFSEKLHQEVMKKYWAYAQDEAFGIRPAPGYPICPDHSEKATFWRLLEPKKRIGIQLTESYMMIPASSTCGYYIAHPKSQYFSVGSIGKDQDLEYQNRKKQLKK